MTLKNSDQEKLKDAKDAWNARMNGMAITFVGFLVFLFSTARVVFPDFSHFLQLNRGNSFLILIMVFFWGGLFFILKFGLLGYRKAFPTVPAIRKFLWYCMAENRESFGGNSPLGVLFGIFGGFLAMVFGLNAFLAGEQSIPSLLIFGISECIFFLLVLRCFQLDGYAWVDRKPSLFDFIILPAGLFIKTQIFLFAIGSLGVFPAVALAGPPSPNSVESKRVEQEYLGFLFGIGCVLSILSTLWKMWEILGKVEEEFYRTPSDKMGHTGEPGNGLND